MNLRRNIVLAILLAAPATADAGPCLLNASQPTLRDDAAQSKFIIYARPESTNKDGRESETTFFIIRDVIKDHAILVKRMPIDAGRVIPIADQRNPPTFLVFGDVLKNKPDLFRGVLGGPALVEYVRGLLAVAPKGEVEVLRYCFDYLSSAEQEVANDAFAEFRRASATDIACVAQKLNPSKVRRLLSNEKTPSHQLAFYGFLLGNCGERQDKVLLRTLIDRQLKEGSQHLYDVLVGFALLDPEEGSNILRKLASDRSADFLARYSALKVVRFFNTERSGVLAKKELVAVLSPLLDQEDIFDLAIEELRRWRSWDQTERILALFDKKISNEGAGKLLRRSILRYALVCPEERCKAFIAVQRKKDPEFVRDQEELLELEVGKGPK